MNNKKGFIAGSAVDIWAIIALVVILVVFFFIFWASGDKMKIEVEGEVESTMNDLVLVNLMRSEVDVYSEEGMVIGKQTVSDLVKAGEYDKYFEGVIIDKLNSLEHRVFVDGEYRIIKYGLVIESEETYEIRTTNFRYHNYKANKRTDILLSDVGTQIRVVLVWQYFNEEQDDE